MLEWQGRNRELVAALVRHSNMAIRVNSIAMPFYKDVSLRTNEIQVLEYIVEHKDDDMHMLHMAEKLYIPNSSFSRIIKKLCDLGYVDKYQHTYNRKNIILKPSELGLEAYNSYISNVKKDLFEQFFEDLKCISDNDIEVFVNALDSLTGRMKIDAEKNQNQANELIKIS